MDLDHAWVNLRNNWETIVVKLNKQSFQWHLLRKSLRRGETAMEISHKIYSVLKYLDLQQIIRSM